MVGVIPLVGTSESSPWAHAPGMPTFTGSYTPQAGDEFIFKGGDTWHNANFPFAPRGGGSSSHEDLIGVDKGWYDGSSWSQPVFDADSENITASDPHLGTADVFVDLTNDDYTTIDNIEFENWYESGIGNSEQCNVVDLGTDTNITVDQIFVTGPQIKDPNTTCTVVAGNPNLPYAGNSVLENSTITGNSASGSTATYGTVVNYLANVENNVISGWIQNIYPAVPSNSTGVVSGNTVSDCAYPAQPSGNTQHMDALLVNVAGTNSTLIIHDNVIHDIGGGCASMWVSDPGETDYIYNNVLYKLYSGEPLMLGDLSSQNGTAYVWDNTLEGAWDGTSSPNTSCVEGAHGTMIAVTVQNNLCVTNSGGVSSGLSGNDTVTNNIVLTTSQAGSDASNGQLSNSPFQYALTGGSSPGVGQGTNLSSDCSGALQSLCSDTTYAGARSTLSRPGSGNWDAGAYQEP